MRSIFVPIAIVALAACAAAGPSVGAPAAPARSFAAASLTPSTPGATLTNAAAPTVLSGRVTVSMGEHFFDPALITVKVGTTVTWRNFGQQTHDVKTRDGTFYSNLFGPGGSFSFTFTKPGRYPYLCTIHEGDGMFGEIDVQ